MTVELASVTVIRKPWGKTDLRPWSELGHDGVAVGELWFQRSDRSAPEPALLLKLLFTEEPLSIQVHPDDDFAVSIGLPRGKTEAWYVLSAEAGAKVALGLKRQLTRPQLRSAIGDGSIADLVKWRGVEANEAILVPAGTIHAIGAGVVIAEVQQRSDTTFRLFDHGRQRGIHVDGAVGAASLGPPASQHAPEQLSEARRIMAQCAYFVLEEIDLAPRSHWEINAPSETWVLILEGEAAFDLEQFASGDAIFMDAHRTRVQAGDRGLRGLIAYVASAPLPDLLVDRNGIPIEAMVERFPELALKPQAPVETPSKQWGTRP